MNADEIKFLYKKIEEIERALFELKKEIIVENVVECSKCGERTRFWLLDNDEFVCFECFEVGGAYE